MQRLPRAERGINFVTGAASHELLEAASDPFPTSAPAFDDVDFSGSGWEINAGGPEIGDLCKLGERAPSSRPRASGSTPFSACGPTSRPRGDTSLASRTSPARVLTSPRSPDLEGVEISYPDYYYSGVLVEPGSSRTIEVHLASDAPTSGPWTVSATEKGGPQAPADPDNLLSFAWDKTTGQNGDVLHLTITRKETPSTTYTHGLPLLISSTLGTTTNSFWTMVGE